MEISPSTPISLSTLYRNLCHADKNMSATMLTRVWEHAVETGDHQLAATVAAHPNLPDTLTESVDAHPSAAVQIAWITRPDMTVERAVSKIDNEKRVTVLAAIASIENLNPTFIDRLADRNHPRVADALATHQTLTKDAAVKVADTIAEGLRDAYPGSWKYQATLRKVCVLHPELISDLFAKAPEVMIRTIGSDITLLGAAKDTSGAIVSAFLDDTRQTVLGTTWNSSYRIRSCAEFVAKLLPTVTNEDARARARLFASWARHEQNDPSSAAIIETALGHQEYMTDDLITEALASGNPHLISAVLRSHDVDDDTLLALISAIDNTAYAALNDITDQLLARAETNVSLVTKAFNTCPALAAHLWSVLHVDPNKAKMNALRQVMTDADLDDNVRWTIGSAVLSNTELPVDEIKHYPFQCVMNNGGNNLARVGNLLENTFTTNDEWNLFTVLANSNPRATIAEIIELVHATTS